MLIQNIDVNALKKNEKETSHDKGWGIMEQGAIALVVIIVLALVFGGLYMLRSRTGVANESSNIQTIITSTQGLLKGSDGYTFTSGAKMTGALIQMGGVPKTGNDSNLLIVFYVQIMPDDFVMQLHRF